MNTSQGKVRVLPEDVANRIAAGEVVERPASVVKELVENAIDSGARNISVKVRGAGREKIVVSDDGSGMSPEDAHTSIKRHATSKIKSAEDLDNIHTLGFRGEALPSIASVSKMRITTRVQNSDEAQELVVEGGEVASSHGVAGPPGTEFEVSQLFYNTPVRAKFLKTDATELKNIIDTVGRISLVHPHVGFELKSENRTLLALPPDQPLAERAAELAGIKAKDGSGRLYWEQKEGDGRSLSFAFTAPHENKGRRNTIRLFVNRRAVTDRILMGAVMQGYRGLIESGRYPVAMLWLELPPDEVDVNVHPAKREVRFRDEGHIFRWVAGSVAAALARAPWARGEDRQGASGTRAPWEEGAGGMQGYGDKALPPDRSQGVAEALSEYAKRPAPAGYERPSTSSRAGSSDFLRKMGGYAPSHSSGAEARGRANADGEECVSPHGGFERLAVPEDSLDTVFGRLSYLGAFDATYLLFEELDLRELVLIDQHAAHERILYEALINGSDSGLGRAQQLLVPVVVDLTAAEEAMVAERAGLLEEVGIKTEPFGPRSLSVTQAPSGFSSSQLSSMVKDLLAQELPDAKEGVDDMRDAIAARAACSAAVKARKQMTLSEVRELMVRLATLENPTHCPHGRPLVLKLSRERVESLFHRR